MAYEEDEVILVGFHHILPPQEDVIVMLVIYNTATTNNFSFLLRVSAMHHVQLEGTCVTILLTSKVFATKNKG